MRIWNMTPHAINIIRKDHVEFKAEIRKNVALPDYEVATSLPTDGVLSAKLESTPTEDILGIPCYEKQVVGCDPLPDEVEDGDIVVVSALYATAYKRTYGDTDQLFTIADPVYSNDGKTVLGSLGICPAF